MNSVANGKIRERTPFRDVYIQPAAGDNGTALGAAFHTWHQLSRQPRRFVMSHGYWGPEYDDDAIEHGDRARDADVRELQCARRTIADDDALCEWTAARLAAGSIVGWFQGRMEWGARALGNRSILADPRRADMREIINTKIKFREKFRPFAPSTLVETAADYFVGAVPDPFMIQVVPGPARSASHDPGRDACRWLGAPADRGSRGEPAVLDAHRALWTSDRRAGPAEHVVQRERADRADAG